MSFPFIDLQAQYQAYKDEIDNAIHAILDTSRYIMGAELQGLEKELSDYTGAPHAIGCSSGSTALELVLRALEIGPGDEVITTPFTFFATAEMISLVGATPVFVDIEEDTYNIDPFKIEAAITAKTKAIMPVGIFGQTSDMDAINAIAKAHKLAVIEDAAQSFGGEYNGKKSCNLSDFGTTSFFPAKPLGCYGDAGAVFCQDDAMAEKVRLIANHGQNARYKHSVIGGNYRLDAIQAAILRVKLKHFGAEMTTRQEIAKRYDEGLQSHVVIPTVKENRVSAYAQYSIRVKERESVIAKLGEMGVPTAIHYPIPLYKQDVYAGMNINPADFPVTELVSAEIMSLPFSPFLKPEDQEKTIEAVKKVVA